MKAAIITANFGGFDKVRFGVVQEDVPQYQFYDSATPFPLSGLSNRMKGKYFKMQAHRMWLFDDFDVLIWHDASIEIISPDFAGVMIERVQGHDIAIARHPKRPTVEEELLFIRSAIKDDADPYLSKRYDLESIEAELNLLSGSNYQLYACSLFAVSLPFAKRFLDEWWELTVRYSELDQAVFSRAFRLAKINSFPYNDLFDLGLIKKHTHEGD